MTSDTKKSSRSAGLILLLSTAFFTLVFLSGPSARAQEHRTDAFTDLLGTLLDSNTVLWVLLLFALIAALALIILPLIAGRRRHARSRRIDAEEEELLRYGYRLREGEGDAPSGEIESARRSPARIPDGLEELRGYEHRMAKFEEMLNIHEEKIGFLTELLTQQDRRIAALKHRFEEILKRVETKPGAEAGRLPALEEPPLERERAPRPEHSFEDDGFDSEEEF